MGTDNQRNGARKLRAHRLLCDVVACLYRESMSWHYVARGGAAGVR